MEKRIYIRPLMEVEELCLQSVVLAGSPVIPPFPHPAPPRGVIE